MSYNLDERLSFLAIDDNTRRDLREAKPFIDAALPAILKGFYQHIDRFPHMASMFTSPSVKDHAREMQLKHWGLITAANFDDDYVASVRKVGEAHNRLGLEPRWYIGGYAFITNAIIEAVSSHLTDGRGNKGIKRRNAWLRALNTAAMLDMDYAITVYLDAGNRDKLDVLTQLTADFDSDIRDVITSVAHSTSTMQMNAQKLADVARESKEKTIIVAAAAVQTSQTSSTVAAASEELSASIHEISTQVQRSQQVTQDATKMAQAVNQSMELLLEQTRKISQVTEFIDSVASQINLLALNATIESARAGEAGRGFTVVASEVKNLAGQTTKAAGDISTQVQDIQHASHQAEEQIRNIVSIIGQISSNTASIATAIEQQSAATQEIAKNVIETSAAAEDVSRNITIVEQGSELTNSSSVEVLQSADQLDEQTRQLREKVDAFLRAVHAA